MGKKLVNDSTTLHQILDAVSAKTTAQLDQKKEKARLKENYLQRKLVTKQEREKEKEQKIEDMKKNYIEKMREKRREKKTRQKRERTAADRAASAAPTTKKRVKFE